MKIEDVFDIYGGQGKYTEAYIEKNRGEYPLISGQTIDSGVIGLIDTYDYEFEECLTYTKDGEKSGTIFMRNGKFSLTSHANALVPKEKFKDKIDLEWFRYKYEPIFKSIVIGRFGVPSLPQSILNALEIDIPSPKMQDIELVEFRKKEDVIQNIRTTISSLRKEISDLNYSIIKIPKEKTIEEKYGYEIFDILEKNSGITEKFIYDNYNPTVDQLPIFNGSENIWGFIPESSLIDDKKPLKTTNGNVIIIVRKGVNAGHIFYQDKFDKSIIAEDAIPIRIKKDFADKIDIHWFIREYGQIFRKAAIGKFSSATFSNALLNKMLFKIPSKTFQQECSNLYQQIDLRVDNLNKYLNKIDKRLFELENATIQI